MLGVGLFWRPLIDTYGMHDRSKQLLTYMGRFADILIEGQDYESLVERTSEHSTGELVCLLGLDIILRDLERLLIAADEHGDDRFEPDVDQMLPVIEEFLPVIEDLTADQGNLNPTALKLVSSVRSRLWELYAYLTVDVYNADGPLLDRFTPFRQAGSFSYPLLYLRLGDVAAKLGRRGDAADWYQIFLEEEPGTVSALALLSRTERTHFPVLLPKDGHSQTLQVPEGIVLNDDRLIRWAERSFVDYLGDDPIAAVLSARDKDQEPSFANLLNKKFRHEARPDDIDLPEVGLEEGSARLAFYGLILVGICNRDLSEVGRLCQMFLELGNDPRSSIYHQITLYASDAAHFPTEVAMAKLGLVIKDRIGKASLDLREVERKELLEAEYAWGQFAKSGIPIGMVGIVTNYARFAEHIFERVILAPLLGSYRRREGTVIQEVFRYFGASSSRISEVTLREKYGDNYRYLLTKFLGDLDKFRKVRNDAVHGNPVTAQDVRDLRLLLFGPEDRPDESGMLAKVLSLANKD